MRWLILLIISTASLSARESCSFCDSKVLEKQMFYEGDLTVALINYLPLLKGHSMVMPKRHVERFEDLDVAEILDIHKTAEKVGRAFQEAFGTSDYLLYLQNGSKAGQTVDHVHFHLVPRKEKSVWTKLTLLGKVLQVYTTGRKPMPDDEIAKEVALMKKAIDGS